MAGLSQDHHYCKHWRGQSKARSLLCKKKEKKPSRIVPVELGIHVDRVISEIVRNEMESFVGFVMDLLGQWIQWPLKTTEDNNRIPVATANESAQQFAWFVMIGDSACMHAMDSLWWTKGQLTPRGRNEELWPLRPMMKTNLFLYLWVKSNRWSIKSCLCVHQNEWSAVLEMIPEWPVYRSNAAAAAESGRNGKEEGKIIIIVGQWETSNGIGE